MSVSMMAVPGQGLQMDSLVGVLPGICRRSMGVHSKAKQDHGGEHDGSPASIRKQASRKYPALGGGNPE
ncbi:hypothetical protein E4U43_008653 [Claviceps pusilla]|uniref:Uncharacterized protein n=1 Tax=Claviceps pusilla TaxID=123648 RepID=A0A9P7SY39_9HYPO|nr:hypothetical protein E4U43_008653 [Claviceps pusilla]